MVDAAPVFIGKEVSTSHYTDTTLVGEERDIESREAHSAKTHWLARWWKKSTNELNVTRESEEEVKDPYELQFRSLDESPEGYAEIATFQSSDRNFMQYRSFTYLRCRLLSDLQYEIGRLEFELQQLDEYDSHHDSKKLACRRHDLEKASQDLQDEDWPSHLRRTRSEIFADLRAKLADYDELLLKTKEVAALQRPSDRDYESVKRWFGHREPLVRRESKYIRQKEDLITLRTGRQAALFDNWVEPWMERQLYALNSLFRKVGIDVVHKIFISPEMREKSESGYITYYSPTRVGFLINLLITVVIFVLLVLPVIVMYEVTKTGQRQSPLSAIGILIVFTLVFTMAISTLTAAKRHELFAAAAAYAAVLVVFIGNFGVQQVTIVPQ